MSVVWLQLRDALKEAGFLPGGGGKVGQKPDSGEVEVVKAVLCAGLYPHLARVHLPRKQYEELSGGAFQRNVPAKDVKFFVQGGEGGGEGNPNSSSSGSSSSGRNSNGESTKSNDGGGGTGTGTGTGTATGSSEGTGGSSRVFLHPSSALFGQGLLDYRVPWLVYSSKVCAFWVVREGGWMLLGWLLEKAEGYVLTCIYVYYTN